MIKWLLAALLLLPSAAWAQNQGQIVPSGSFTPGHTVRCQNSTCTVAVDGGGSAGSNKNGQGYLTEIGITNTGTPLCINDALINAVGGYHQLCLGPNALGGGLISYNAYGGATPLGLNFNINGTNYAFPPTGVGTGNVVGPNSSVVGDVPCFNNTAGTLLSDGCATARFLNASTAPITTAGQLVKSVNNNASNTAASIYQMAFGPSPTVTTYDLIQAVAVVPSGSNLLGTFGVGSYVLNQNPSVGDGTSQNAVSLFGVGVGAANNAATWGGNVLVTDNTSQSASSFANQKLTGFEIDVNVWNTTTETYGLLIVGASGAQPTLANAILVASLDFTGANRAKWSTGFQAGGGCCTIGALIGTSAASGNSLSSMPLDFFVTNSSGSILSYSLTGTPTGFLFSHNFGTAINWSFDGNLSIQANEAILMNGDNVVSTDVSHNLFLGFGPSVASATIGNTTASLSLTGAVIVAPQLQSQSHAGGNACLGYNASTKAIYVSSTVTTC